MPLNADEGDEPISLISSQLMAAQQRPRGGRGPSWSRLKTAPTDPLEAYGLPSKGETRLNDSKAQESYYAKVVERYMRFCAASGGGEALDEQFAALALSSTPSSTSLSSSKHAPPSTKPAPPTPAAAAALAVPRGNTPGPHAASNPTAELSTILSAMRKLRESITATGRRDAFAQRAYIFVIHSALLLRAWEAYHPALLYLLHAIHPSTPLSQPELHEMVGVAVLDLACRQGELAEAFRVKAAWRYEDRRVEMVLKALVADNWCLFWRLRRVVDGYQRVLMGFAEEGVRVHALKCLGRSYLTADKAFVERCAGADWAELVRRGVGWELVEGERVVIRRPKVK